MLPVLLDLHFIKIYTFGVFALLAFFWALFVVWRTIKLTSYKEDEIFDGIFISLIGGLFFSRLLYVITHFKFFGFSILKFLLINGYPGLTFYGFLLGGLLTFYAYCNIKKISFSNIIDYMIPSIFLGIAIGKLGSFFSGGDVGTVTKFLLHVNYVGYQGLRHIPALYEALLFFVGSYVTYHMLLAIRREKLNKMSNLAFAAFYLPLVLLLLDKFKQNHLYFIGINVSFLLSLIFVFVFGIYFIYFFRKEIISKSMNFKLNSLNYVQKTFRKTNRGDKKKVDE